MKIFCEDGNVKIFENPAAAMRGLSEFGITMDLPEEEPDLETTLSAAGWQTVSPHRRKMSECDFVDAVKTLLDNKHLTGATC